MTTDKKNLPRGVRNANPGNIELGDPWQGMRARQTDGRFAQFETPAYGIRALARTLITYQDKHGIRSVRRAINRWAPPVENNTSAYVSQVALAMRVDPDETIDVHEYATLRPMVEAIIRHENGQGPLKTLNTWYDDATIDEGLRMAGVRPHVQTAAAVPVTKETVGATATGAVGVGTIAEALPGVVAAIKGSEDHLASGDWLRIAIGVLLVGAAVFVAYAQVKRHKAGVL